MLEYRPRPALWRVALLSFSQIVVAVWLTNVVVAALEIFAVKRWIFYATPWDTPWHHLGVRAIDVDARYAGAAAAGACLAAAIVLWLWPTRQTLASRHFAHTIAGVLAIFGVFRIAPRAPLAYAAPALVGAIIIAFVAERRALSLLGNVFDFTRGKRLAFWLLRIVSATALLGAASWLARDRVGVYLAAGYTTMTFAVALFIAPPVRFERLDNIELRAGVVPLVLAAIVILAGSAALFGVTRARAIHATPQGWKLAPIQTGG